METIKNGEYVVVQRGDHQRIIHFMEHQAFIFGKGNTQQDILLKNALGSPFYTAFRIVPVPLEEYPPDTSTPQQGNKTGSNKSSSHQKGKKPPKKLYTLEKVNEPASKSFSQLTYEPTNALPKGKDNRHIVDDKVKSSQPLGQSDIHGLKDQGLSSQEILTTIISSSTSFSLKTEFSQEKYLKKKEKVHGDLLLFYRPDLSTVCEFFFKKDPSKILGLRLDSLSQILAYSNVHANGRYLLYENANGLLVGGMLMRMGGFGQLLHCHAGTNPQKQAMNYLNLGDEILKPLRNLDIFYLIKGRLGEAKSSINGSKIEAVDLVEGDDADSPLCKKSKVVEDIQMEVVDSKGDENLQLKPNTAHREENEKSLEMLNIPFHGLVICGKEHPLSIFQRLLPHLGLSSPFVVYSIYPEPLMECYTWVKESGFGANMHIVDNWMRNIQVESDRTHPEISMSSSGGYILYGTFVRDAS